MLKEVKRIFEKNNIPFYLACGTALGCARHGGFIPWDDDVDIYVYGSDYERIKEVIKNEPSCNLEFQDYSTVDNYPYWFPKLSAKDTILVEKSFGNQAYSCGVYIDLFPIFYASDVNVVRKMQEVVRYIHYALIRAYYNETFSSGYRRIIKYLAKTFTKPNKLQKNLKKTYCNGRNKGYYLIDPGVFGRNALLKSASFDKTLYMKYDDDTMPMPIGYKQYLNDYYGEYMELPPEKERISRHHIAKLEIQGVKELNE